MTRDVNPFGPWDPSSSDPEHLGASRAWTARRKTEPQKLRPDQRLVMGIWICLILVGVVWVVVLSGLHVTRAASVILPVGLGLTAAIVWCRKRSWLVRTAWVLVGAAAAVLGWWFMPTTQGLSLWEARSRLAEARALPTGDRAAYEQGLGPRRQVSEQFWTLRAEMQTAELDWGGRTVDQALTELAALSAGDLEAFARGSATRNELSTYFPTLQERIDDAECAWVRRSAEKVLAESEVLLGRDPARASTLLREAHQRLRPLAHCPDVDSSLLVGRNRACRALLKAAWLEVAELLKQDRYEEMRAVADRLGGAELVREAREVGAEDERIQYQERCRFLIDLARRAGKIGMK
jgi:hypothetical protein